MACPKLPPRRRPCGSWFLAQLVAASALWTQHAAAAGGTGGIAVDTGEKKWPAAQVGLPQVTATGSTLKIVMANGRTLLVPSDNPARDRFLTIWWQLHDPRNGYFSALDMPFHSVETLIVEAPDYGHLTTSETVSYWAWLEASFGRYSGDYSLLHYVFDRMERYAIPKVQRGTGAYRDAAPATYAPEEDAPTDYPVVFDQNIRVGRDPLASELRAAYGPNLYSMHWLIDTTNWYGYGTGQDPVYINTFQRGAMESVFLTVPHPEIEEFKYGAPGEGFLSLFGADPTGYKQQWRYTNAPDADARLVQATYRAAQFARAAGQEEAVGDLIAKASRMGDTLRYAMFDKYFKTLGCQSPSCREGSGYDAAHYLLGWYYSWGGSYPDEQWSWRVGGSHAHFGYQNPLAAFALSQDAAFAPRTANGARDWQLSLQRQLEFYRWLQSAEGAIAGGATNSWNGRYEVPPPGQSTFYGMSYDPHPVYHNPDSNGWFGWQAWSMERVAEYYAESGDSSIEPLLDHWVSWVLSQVKLSDNGGYLIPQTLVWRGQPTNWASGQRQQSANPLHVAVTEYNEDVGIATSLAKALLYYGQGSKLHRHQDRREATELAQAMIDRTWTHYRDAKGVTYAEVRADYSNFAAKVYVPERYKGRLGAGGIDSTANFLSLRPQYRDDPDFSKVQAYLNGGPAPVFQYHRFWTEVEAALAFAELDRLSP